MKGRDLLVRAAIVAVMTAGIVAGIVLQKPGTEGEIRGAGTVTTTSAAWFCTGLLPRPGRSEIVAIANPGTESLTGRLTVAGGGKTLKTRALEIPALSTISLDIGKEITPNTLPAEITDSQSAGVAAVVELDGSKAAVASASNVTSGPVTDVAVSGCAGSLSERVSISGASSVRGVSSDLYLANPLGHDAVADVSLVTEGGVDEPPKLQKLPVLASSQASYRISDESRRRWALAVEATATAGELAGSVEVASNGKRIGAGIARLVGLSEPSSAWMFPAFSGSDGTRSILSVANPVAETRKVEVRIVPDDSVSPTASDIVRPRTLEIPGESAITLTPSPGLGEGARYGIRVEAPDGKPILASATLSPRAPGRGLGISMGSPRASQRWVLQNPEDLKLPAGSRVVVSVMNLSDRDANIKLSAFGSGSATTVSGLDRVKVGRGRSTTLDLGSAQLPPGVGGVILDSDVPVVAEATFSVGGDAGVTGFDVMPLLSLEIPSHGQSALSRAGLGIPGGATSVVFGLAFLAAATLVVFLDRRARPSSGSNETRSGSVKLGGGGLLAEEVVLSIVGKSTPSGSWSGAGAGDQRTVFVLFSHEGCRACLAARELLDAVAASCGGEVVEVSYEKHPELFDSARVEDVPTTVLVTAGKIEAAWVGPLQNQDLLSALVRAKGRSVQSA